MPPRATSPRCGGVVSGSAPIPPQYVDEVRDAFGVRLFSLWGMSENGAGHHQPGRGPRRLGGAQRRQPDLGHGTAHRPDPGPAGGRRARCGCAGPTQCLGYYRREELYAAELDADGWFDTGDLARHDGRGGIRITGRAKDTMFRNGFIVPTADLEETISRHPKVREATVIGLPVGGGADQMVCAVVLPAAGSAASRSAWRRYTRMLGDTGMTRLFWPERLEVVDDLPKTPTGKVRKVELKERFV